MRKNRQERKLERKDNKKCKAPLWGVSTSHLLDKHDFLPLLDYEPDVIEFYNYKNIAPIIEFCSRHDIRPALHVPTPCDQDVFNRFCPTASGSDEEIELAIQMTKTTIKCASEIGALHVVVHFPTPCPPYFPVTDNEIDRFFGDVCSYADQLNVDLLVENLTPHPHFHKPENYLRLLDDYNLHLCLDVGHAHLLEPHFGVQDFIKDWGNKVKSVHLYNLTEARYHSHGHEPIEEGQKRDGGWIDMVETLNGIIRINNPRVIILEYGPMNSEGIRESAESWRNFKKRNWHEWK